MEGQRVVITGGASGIGLTFARRFAEAGARVALCDADGAAVAEGTLQALTFDGSRAVDELELTYVPLREALREAVEEIQASRP